MVTSNGDTFAESSGLYTSYNINALRIIDYNNIAACLVFKATSLVVLARLSLSLNTIIYQNALPNTSQKLGESFDMMSLGYFLNDW
jgi:hypothetical protein